MLVTTELGIDMLAGAWVSFKPPATMAALTKANIPSETLVKLPPHRIDKCVGRKSQPYPLYGVSKQIDRANHFLKILLIDFSVIGSSLRFVTCDRSFPFCCIKKGRQLLRHMIEFQEISEKFGASQRPRNWFTKSGCQRTKSLNELHQALSGPNVRKNQVKVAATGLIERPIRRPLPAVAGNHLGMIGPILSWERSRVAGEAVAVRTTEPFKVDEEVRHNNVTELYLKFNWG
jgi:hypothetical protein